MSPSTEVAIPVPTVNAAGKLADPPPGLAFVTVMVRGPEAANEARVSVAWISVGLFTVIPFVTISEPKFNEVTPAMNCEPPTVTLRILPRFALEGETLAIVGSGLMTAKPATRQPEPPPGAPLTIVTSHPLAAHVKARLMLALICVKLVTVNELTVISAPSVSALVPATKPVPVITTSRVCPRDPLDGAIAERTGEGFITLKTLTSVAVPPPGGAFVTLTARAPMIALAATDMFAVALVEVETAKEFTVTLTPKEAEVIPVAKFVPVMVTLSVCPLPAEYVLRDDNVGTRFATVNAFANEDDPPPGPPFVTFTLRKPAVAVAAIVIAAVRRVPVLSIARVPTVTPAPTSRLLTPLKKSDPVRTTLRLCPTKPVFGETFSTIGVGFCTSNALARVADPPPGAEFVMVISRRPGAASRATRKLPVICVGLTNVADTRVKPSAGDAVVTPGMKPVPLMVTFTTFPLPPLPGTTLVIVGAGLVTVNPPASVAVPAEPEFETETSLAPVAAVREIVRYMRICELLTTKTESDVMPAPNSTVVPPGTKLVPLRITMSDWPRTLEFGVTDANVGSGTTVKAPARVAVPPPGVGFETTAFRAPAMATGDIVTCTIMDRSFDTETEFTAIPAPNDTAVTPGMNPDPWTVTETDWPMTPVTGERVVIVGAGLRTRKPFENVPVP
jgi:hypothetical protein